MIRRPNLSRMWEAFLSVQVTVPAKRARRAKNRGEAPVAARAPEFSEAVRRDALDGPDVALACARCVRSEVLPLVRRLERLGAIDWYAILFHDRSGGVPTTEEDGGAYAHLRLGAVREGDDLGALVPSPPWRWVRLSVDVSEIAGVDRSALAGAEISRAWGLLGAQSEWYLDFLEQYESLDGPELLRHLGQHLHFLANVTRMRVG